MDAANGTTINTFGKKPLVIHTAAAHYNWDFIVADVILPIIGADLLDYFDLLVDVRRKRLIPASCITLRSENYQLHSASALTTGYGNL